MLTQDGRVELSEITDFNLLKSELDRLPAVDVGDYIIEICHALMPLIGCLSVSF